MAVLCMSPSENGEGLHGYGKDNSYVESRVPRLNVHTNQILGHTFSHVTLDSVVS